MSVKQRRNPGGLSSLGALALPAGVALICMLCCWSRAARAQAKPPPARANIYSGYEREAIAGGVAKLGGEIDPEPEGKIIEKIEIVSLEVIEPRDRVPLFLNVAHVKTQDYVIAREVLVKPGERWQQVLVNETARNLRALPQLSLVVGLALTGSSPDKVRLAIITKDVWSLRLSWDLIYTPGGFEKLVISPVETNLLGLHQTVGTRAELQPESLALGARYEVPRLFGSRVLVGIEGNAIFNRQSGAPEGSYGYLNVLRPLYSLQTEWSWRFNYGWRNEVTRRYVNGRVGTFDGEATPFDDQIPFQYRSRIYTGDAAVTRSYGWGIKHTFTLGFEGAYRAFSTTGLEGYDPQAIDEFVRSKVPVTDHRFNPFFEYGTYSSDFMTVLELDTLGLQEDVRLGHGLTAKIYPVSRALGSSRNYLGVQLGAGYSVPLGDGVASLSTGWLQEASSLSEVPDASFIATALLATPRTGIGRLLLYSNLLYRYRNYQNRTSILGGEGSLRGYPSHFFVGEDVFVYNLEFRTRPVEVLSSQLSAAVFHDAGDAFDGLDELHVRRSVGVGLRALFPQLSRNVLRLDVGAPLTRYDLVGVPPVSFFIAFGQAFPPQPGAQ